MGVLHFKSSLAAGGEERWADGQGLCLGQLAGWQLREGKQTARFHGGHMNAKALSPLLLHEHLNLFYFSFFGGGRGGGGGGVVNTLVFRTIEEIQG